MPGTSTSARPHSDGRRGLTALQQAARVDLGRGGTGSEGGTPADRAARVGHDLQTPVAIILGLCARLEDGGVDAEQAADLERIRAQAQVIAGAAGALALPEPALRSQPALVDAARVAREVAAELAVLARERGARILVDASRDAPVNDDGAQLRAAVTNLTANAVRQVGPGGLVRCSVSTRGPQVMVEVADSGPGVPEAEREAVLRPGVQGSGSRGSSGLGLSIVSDAAAGLGGTLDVGEAPEGGALFTLTVPRARRDAARRRRRPRAG